MKVQCPDESSGVFLVCETCETRRTTPETLMCLVLAWRHEVRLNGAEGGNMRTTAASQAHGTIVAIVWLEHGREVDMCDQTGFRGLILTLPEGRNVR